MHLALLVLVVFASLVGTQAAPPAVATIESQNFENNIDNYNFRYETSDGQTRQESGKVVTKGTEEILQVRGFYWYYAPNGRLYRVEYTADENGFQHLTPRPPAASPIPTSAIASLNGGGFG